MSIAYLNDRSRPFLEKQIRAELDYLMNADKFLEHIDKRRDCTAREYFISMAWMGRLSGSFSRCVKAAPSMSLFVQRLAVLQRLPAQSPPRWKRRMRRSIAP